MSQTQDKECHLDDYLLQTILSNLCGADVCRAQVCLAMAWSQYCARGYSGLAHVPSLSAECFFCGAQAVNKRWHKAAEDVQVGPQPRMLLRGIAFFFPDQVCARAYHHVSSCAESCVWLYPCCMRVAG